MYESETAKPSLACSNTKECNGNSNNAKERMWESGNTAMHMYIYVTAVNS